LAYSADFPYVACCLSLFGFMLFAMSFTTDVTSSEGMSSMGSIIKRRRRGGSVAYMAQIQLMRDGKKG
jgi:hypothetical protein